MKFLSLLILFSSGIAFALPLSDWQAATVKIESFPCLTKSPRYQGSGLFIYGKYTGYNVITSEHVVLNGKEKEVCHEVNGVPAELKVSDFSHGLAVLFFKTVPSIKAKPVYEPTTSFDPIPSNLVALGYPAGTVNLSTLQNGQLITDKSTRALIAGVSNFIEADKLPVEYGMSGGILLSTIDGKDYRLIGILSHQVLRRDPGAPTRPDQIRPGETRSSDLTLAIPLDKTNEWIQRAINNHFRVVWKRNYQAQLKGEEAIQYGNILFSLKNEKAKDVWDIGGPSGGSDGSGIGGDGNKSQLDPETLQVIDLSDLGWLSHEENNAYLKDQPAFVDWKSWISNRQKVKIAFLKDPKENKLYRINSLSQFLTLWLRDGYKPIVLHSKTDQLKTEVDALLKITKESTLLVQQALDKKAKVVDPIWLARIRNHILMAENALVTSQDIKSLLDGQNDDYWRKLYGEDFDFAVSLEASLQKLIAQMQKMGL